ncbi:hypothetical protein N7G274_007895 [Stereocaulon virgatum]|uniref:Het-C-domain-containing protein n=1 Tax=Stereocaulon virgatum TaxID=373712 RepID=A0ABR4A4C2_9LECA
MPSVSPSFTFVFSAVILFSLLLSPAAAFGAGNIASIARIEGTNWRHGDIEDTLLNILMSRAAGGKKFGKLDVKRVYFGNWLRDYSQAVDVGTVKYVSAEAIRIILWVLGFMSFGYGTGEFEVTMDRLGCYRPEEHIDNPKDYADNIDARQYDRRLRGPVDERRELSVNPQTGLKNYIATENIGITTSAGLIRRLFGRSIQLGRQYSRSHNKADLYEALRLLGTGCHCLEDYSAHSNYTELALIELGESGVFPHVGRRTMMNLPGARQQVYPIITGTFGGVDFLHSVMGEFSDKATQSEIQELQGTMESSSQGGNTSLLQDLLNQVPSSMFGGKDQASKANELQANATAAQMQNTHISPRQPEAWTRQLQDVQKQIYPIIEWHDELMQSITEAIEKIPILPTLIEQLTDQLNMFVFSLLAPFVVPIINQVKTELNTGSSEIIESSKEKQLIVFHNDSSTDPTHSMLSKDHFSNILNEPAGKVASQVLKWVVPQLIACWDDERIDVDRTLTRIVTGVFHHPAVRDYGDDGAVDGRRLMFGVVEQWWGSRSEQDRQILRDQLSRKGVEQGRNHKPGVQDTGHGCGKPLGMPGVREATSSGVSSGGGSGIGGIAMGIAGGLAGGAVLTELGSAFAGKSEYDSGYSGGGDSGGGMGKFVEGGAFGAIGGALLGEGFSGSDSNKHTYQNQQYAQDGSYTQSVTETGYNQQRYGQAEYSETAFPEGGRRQQFERYEQDDYGRAGYGEQVIRESRPTYGGGYEETTETRYGRPGSAWNSEVRVEGRSSPGGEVYEETKRYSGRGGYREEETLVTETDNYGYQQNRPRFEERVETTTYGFGGGDYGRGREEEIEERTEDFGGGRQYGGGREYETETTTYGSGGGYGGREEEYVQEERTEEYGGGREEEVFEERTEDYDRRGGGYGQEEVCEERYEDDY